MSKHYRVASVAQDGTLVVTPIDSRESIFEGIDRYPNPVVGHVIVARLAGISATAQDRIRDVLSSEVSSPSHESDETGEDAGQSGDQLVSPLE